KGRRQLGRERWRVLVDAPGLRQRILEQQEQLAARGQQDVLDAEKIISRLDHLVGAVADQDATLAVLDGQIELGAAAGGERQQCQAARRSDGEAETRAHPRHQNLTLSDRRFTAPSDWPSVYA